MRVERTLRIRRQCVWHYSNTIACSTLLTCSTSLHAHTHTHTHTHTSYTLLPHLKCRQPLLAPLHPRTDCPSPDHARVVPVHAGVDQPVEYNEDPHCLHAARPRQCEIEGSTDVVKVVEPSDTSAVQDQEEGVEELDVPMFIVCRGREGGLGAVSVQVARVCFHL